ncbi:UNVERIFIED_CONTAM: hypothetical protein NCL1_27506 [Trichonephila clavipes]
MCELTSRVLLKSKRKLLVPDHNSRCTPSVSRSQKGFLQAVTWPSSDQYSAITGTKTKSALIGEHITTPLYNDLSRDITEVADIVI